MSEIKVNGNIEEALKKFKNDNAQETGFFKKFVKENVMKNQV